jgi:hypothetical protein
MWEVTWRVGQGFILALNGPFPEFSLQFLLMHHSLKIKLYFLNTHIEYNIILNYVSHAHVVMISIREKF